MAQEMMHPLGVEEAAGKRLIAPGSTNVVYYVDQIKQSRPGLSSSLSDQSGERVVFFHANVLRLAFTTF